MARAASFIERARGQNRSLQAVFAARLHARCEARDARAHTHLRTHKHTHTHTYMPDMTREMPLSELPLSPAERLGSVGWLKSQGEPEVRAGVKQAGAPLGPFADVFRERLRMRKEIGVEERL